MHPAETLEVPDVSSKINISGEHFELYSPGYVSTDDLSDSNLQS